MKPRPFPRLPWLAVLAALLLARGLVSALSVIPPDFNVLVDEADSIFQGEVLLVHSDWTGIGENRHIATFVQFRVIQIFKGNAPNPQTLEILGGTVGDRSLIIPGLPQFQVGNNEILFVKGNGKDMCPLVGVFHGRFRVKMDFTTASERVALHDGQPLTDTKQIGQSAESPSSAAVAGRSLASAMTVREFGQRIQARLAETAANPSLIKHSL